MATTTTAPPTKTLVIGDGTTLGYRELGSGPPILLLHGWPTSSHLWRNVMPAIAEHNRVLALDMPGFGASDKPADGRYNFADFEAAIDGFLAALGVDESVGLAGHDLGGPIAVRWMLGRPGRASRLALLNTLLYPEFSETIVEVVVELTTPGPREHRTSDEGLAEIMRLGVADPAVITDEVMAAVTGPYGTADDGADGAAARLALARAGVGLSPAGFEEIAAGLKHIDVPVRVVYGEQDRLLPDVADTMARLAADVPHAEVTALPGCGHFLLEEDPTAVATALAAFFAP